MEFKDGIIILINLAILGTVIAAAVYIFQIGNKDRSVKCGAVDTFSSECDTFYGSGKYPCQDVSYDSGWGVFTCNDSKQGYWDPIARQDVPAGAQCVCADNTAGLLQDWNYMGYPGDGVKKCNYNPDTGEVDNVPCGGGSCYEID